MCIVISFSPEVEAECEKAAQEGQDVSLVTAELLTRIREWKLQDLKEAMPTVGCAYAGIQRDSDL